MYGILRFAITSVRRDSESGATAVEYALMIALIALAIFAVVGALGVNLGDIFSDPRITGALT